jgi:hypothetical protein
MRYNTARKREEKEKGENLMADTNVEKDDRVPIGPEAAKSTASCCHVVVVFSPLLLAKSESLINLSDFL